MSGVDASSPTRLALDSDEGATHDGRRAKEKKAVQIFMTIYSVQLRERFREAIDLHARIMCLTRTHISVTENV